MVGIKPTSSALPINWIKGQRSNSKDETIHFCQGRKYPKLLIDNYQFQIHRREEKKTRWRCVNCNKTKCTARAFTFGRTVSVYETHNHGCPEIDPKVVLVPQLVRLIRKYNNVQE